MFGAELEVPSRHSWHEMSPRAWPRGRLHPVLPWPRLRERLLASVSHTVLCRLWRKPHFCTSLSTSLSLCLSLSFSLLSAVSVRVLCCVRVGSVVTMEVPLWSCSRPRRGQVPGGGPGATAAPPAEPLGGLPIPLQSFQAWVSPGQPSSRISPGCLGSQRRWWMAPGWDSRIPGSSISIPISNPSPPPHPLSLPWPVFPAGLPTGHRRGGTRGALGDTPQGTGGTAAPLGSSQSAPSPLQA